MKVFLRVAAVLVALGNLCVLGGAAGNPTELESYNWSQLLLNLFVVTFLALAVAEVLIRWGRPLLEGGFFARYAAMAEVVFIGGMAYGALLAFWGGFLEVPPEASNSVPDLMDRIFGGLVVGAVGALMGALVGVAEGLILGFPLAAILGLLRTSH
jgi:hypothetical protein